jgi:hypothetical protein
MHSSQRQQQQQRQQLRRRHSINDKTGFFHSRRDRRDPFSATTTLRPTTVLASSASSPSNFTFKEKEEEQEEEERLDEIESFETTVTEPFTTTTATTTTTAVAPPLASYREKEQEQEEEEEEEEEEPDFFQLPISAATTRTTTTTTTKETTTASPAISLEGLHTKFSIGLMAISGFVEGYCLKKYGCFPNMMTGTVVKLMENLSNGGGDLSAICRHASMISCYMVGSAVFALYKHHVENDNRNHSHTNHNTLPRRRTRRSELLNGSATIAIAILLLSDLVGSLSARLPLLAMSFGVLHAVALDTVGVVPFALTGHMTKIAQGVTNEFCLTRGTLTRRRRSKPDASYRTSKGYHTSVKGLLAFMGSAVVANIVCRSVNTNIMMQQSTWLSVLKLPSLLGTSLALLYGVLFRWYTNACDKQQQQE